MAPAAKRGGRPRSPTLSDAGMILPAFDPSDARSTSSPPPYVERPPSPSTLFPRRSLSPSTSTTSSHSTLRNMSNAEPAHHDATQSGASDTWSPHDHTNDHDYDHEHDQRRASVASTMLSEDFENWPGFSTDTNNHSGSSPRNPYAVDDTDNENDDDDESDPHSSAALSRRAEIILANAKKRLNVMEGNLRGARESLVVSPTHSGPRSTSELSHHIATTRDRDRRLYAGIGPIPPRTLSYRPSLLYPNGSPNHARGLSETSVQLSFTPSYTSRTASNKRASSAMGGATNSPWSPEGLPKGRFPIKESHSVDSMRDRSGWAHTARDIPARPGSIASRSPPGLATLPEDGDGPRLHRSASATVGLRDQMNDLKGRISSLKQRAQEDNLRRRSMQNLRTPSPFTSADTWDTGKNGARANSGLGIRGVSPKDDVIYEDEQDGPHTPDSTASQREGEALLNNGVDYDKPNNDVQDDDDDTSFEEDQSTEEEDATDFVSSNGDDVEVGGDSVYEDAVYEMPVTERHEDRIDAFDYEHFFLHSAMGTYGIQARRGSTSSASSTATTRPVTAMQTSEEITDAAKRVSIHQRNPSADSISTVASFATAAEGRSDDEDEENEQMDQFSQQLLASQRPPLASLRSDSAINMRRGNALSPTQTTLSRGSSRGSSSPGELASGLQVSKMFSIVTESTRDEPQLVLNEEDKQLIYSVAAGFQQVCKDLQNPCGEAYERKALRRRLEAVRAILNGETEEDEDDQSF